MDISTAESVVRDHANMLNKRIERVSESDNYFIFSLVSIDESGVAHRTFIPPMAVHKKTGDLVAFNPPCFPEELASIKRIR